MGRVLFFILCLLPQLASAKSRRKADVVVVAELERGTSSPHCGGMAFVDEFEFKVISVERGKLAAKRITVAVLCASFYASHYQLGRLELSRKNPWKYDAAIALARAPKKRFYLLHQRPIEIKYAALLGKPIAKLDHKLRRNSVGANMVHYGSSVFAEIKNGKIVSITFPNTKGTPPRALVQAGIVGVRWKKHRMRDGYIEGAFSAHGGIVGTAAKQKISIRRR